MKKRKKQLKTKRVPMGMAACALLLALAGGIAAVRLLRPFTVALVGLSQKETEAYASLFPPATRFVELPNLDGGANSILKPKPDCIISAQGYPLRRMEKEFVPLPQNILSAIPPSLRDTVRIDSDSYSGLPLQLDHFELAWNQDKFRRLNISAPETRAGMEAALAAHSGPVEPALLFAGADDETLLFVLSVLCVSKTGASGYDTAVTALRSSADFDQVMDSPLGRGDDGLGVSLRSLTGEIVLWQRNGYLHPEWYKLDETEVRRYMEKGLGFMLLGTLSFHRSVEYQTIANYGSQPFPHAGKTAADAIVAPVTAAYFVTRKGKEAAFSGLLATMTSPQKAYALALTTGKATAISAARAPDVQAADVLAWAAGKKLTVNGFFRDAFASTGEEKAFAEKLRSMIRDAR